MASSQAPPRKHRQKVREGKKREICVHVKIYIERHESGTKNGKSPSAIRALSTVGARIDTQLRRLNA
jgi:hypothetical protein